MDQISAEANLTKGSFFHHFESKEAVGRAAVDWWGDFDTSQCAEAWKGEGLNPLEQFHRILDIMGGFTMRKDQVCTCMVRMLAQELAQTHPALREECARQLDIWTRNVAKMLVAAKKRHRPAADLEPVEISWFLNSLWQGSMLIGKTRQRPAMIPHNLAIARQFVDGVLGLKSN